MSKQTAEQKARQASQQHPDRVIIVYRVKAKRGKQYDYATDKEFETLVKCGAVDPGALIEVVTC